MKFRAKTQVVLPATCTNIQGKVIPILLILFQNIEITSQIPLRGKHNHDTRKIWERENFGAILLMNINAQLINGTLAS
jgi:hypothetical protein